MIRLVIGWVALAACTRGMSTPSQATLPVAIVAWPSQLKPSCDIPVIPAPAVIVGFPDSEKIYVTKRDVEGLVIYNASLNASLNASAQAVAKCIGKVTQ